MSLKQTQREGLDLASCRHAHQGGCSTVTINGMPASVVGTSMAGGAILGPGSPTVQAEGISLALIGDKVAPHQEPPHKSATLVGGSADVLADGGGGGGGPGMKIVAAVKPKVDLIRVPGLEAAFPYQQKALDYLEQFNKPGTQWTATLGIGTGLAHHSQIDMYADGKYVGTLQLSLLGPALYVDAKKAPGGSDDGPPFVLPWAAVRAGVVETYKWLTPWGVVICHDFTARLLQSWGFSGTQVAQASPTARGALYVGAEILSKLGIPVTEGWMGIHFLGENAGDGVKAVNRMIQSLVQHMPEFDAGEALQTVRGALDFLRALNRNR